MNANYQAILQRFSTRKVLVIGDLMLDVYLQGTSNRICREAPVPIVDVKRRCDMPGGAATAAVNVAALGARSVYLAITGRDRAARVVASLLRERGVDASGVVYAHGRETITKRRVLSDGQLLVRYDTGSTGDPAPADERALIERLVSLYPTVDAVLVSDYRYGTVTPAVIAALSALQRQYHKLLVVDSPRLPLFRALRPAAVKPNYVEATALLGLEPVGKGQRVEQLLAHGQRILDVTGASVAAVTIDSEGAVIFERDKAPYRTYARPVRDSMAAGAGDTYVSALTIMLALGSTPLAAAEVASAAAGIVVHKDGTATCSLAELEQAFAPPQKIVTSRAELAGRVQAYREQGRRIVFTNGCFDILHRGHINYLAQARSLGDVLIVAVNDDASVRRLKGADRPVNALDDRMVVLAALDSVDHVVSFSEDTPEDLLRLVRPDVYVKGGDYTRATLPEARVVEALGGVVEILPYVEERSTTSVISRIRAGVAGVAGD